MNSSADFDGLNEEQKREARALEHRVLDNRENTFTSTGNKILRHEGLVKDLASQRPHIVSAHIMPTDICNLSCSFCSVADRNAPYRDAVLKKLPMYGRKPFLDFESEIKPAVQTLKKWGLQAIIFSGGGEPTYYKDSNGNTFDTVADYLKNEGLEVALINNGTKLAEMGRKGMDRFEWVRVSWYPFEYPNIYNADYDIPSPGPDTTLGYSLVVTSKPNKNLPEMEGDALYDYMVETVRMMDKHGRERGAEYLRLVPDCHVTGDKHLGLHEVARRLQDEIGGIVLYQQKFHRPPEECHMGDIRPVVYANGLVFPCDSLILNDHSDRRFHPSYAMTDIQNLDAFLESRVGNMTSLIKDVGKMCPNCVFYDNNQTLIQVIKGKQGYEPAGPNDATRHLNFL